MSRRCFPPDLDSQLSGDGSFAGDNPATAFAALGEASTNGSNVWEARAQEWCAITSCHGYCIDALECTSAEVLKERDFARTVFDWQNAAFLLIVVVILGAGRKVFMAMYQLHLSTLAAVEEMKKETGGPAEGVGERDGLVVARPRQHTASMVMQRAHANRSKFASAKWWHQATKEPAVLICLASFYFAISGICSASIEEFAELDRVYPHVGFDTQNTDAGVTARLENIGNGIFWTILGTIMMVIAQLVVRCLMFRGMEDDIVTLVTGGALGDDADQSGSNVAAAIVESGSVLASGFVAAGAISGAPSREWGLDVAAAMLYFAMSQVSLVVYMKIFDTFFITGTVEDALLEELSEGFWLHLPHNQVAKRGNVAAAVSHACMAVSFSLVVAGATYSSFELLNWVVFVSIGGVALLALRPLIDLMLVPDKQVDHAIEQSHNWGHALVVGSGQLYMARVISSLVAQDSCAIFVYNADYYCVAVGESCEGGFTASVANTASLRYLGYCSPQETGCLADDAFTRSPTDENAQCTPVSEMDLVTRLTQTEYAMQLFQVQHLVQVVIALSFLLLGKFAYSLPYCLCDRRERQEGDESFKLASAINHQQNHAVSMSFAAFIFALGSIMQGLFRDLRPSYFAAIKDGEEPIGDGAADTTETTSGVELVLEDAAWAVVSLLMLLIAELICEFVVLSWAKNSRELMVNDNRALACIEGGVYVGSGFVIAAVTQAETLPLSMLFFVLGEVAIVTFSFTYQWATEWNDKAAIESKNIAAGVHWGLSLVALGLLLSRALYLSQSLYTFALWFFLGSPVLLAVIHVVDWVIFPKLDVSKGLSGAKIVVSGAKIANNSVAPEPPSESAQADTLANTSSKRSKRSKSMMPRSMTSIELLTQGSAEVAADEEGNWGIALVAGGVMVSVAQLLNTMLRDCAFEFGVH